MRIDTSIDGRKTALLLAGGGLKGALQIGYLQYIVRERHWPINWAFGVSTGALQAVGLAQGIDYGMTMLEALWLGLKNTGDLFQTRGILGKILGLIGGSGLASNAPLGRLLHDKISVQRIRQSGVECRVGVTNFNTKHFIQVGPNGLSDDAFLKFTLASTSIPGEFSGIWIDEAPYAAGWYFDGGVMNMIPQVDGLIKAGARRIVVCLCNPLILSDDGARYNATIPALKEALNISLHDNWTGDLDRMQKDIEWTNEQVRGKSEFSKGKREIDFIVLAPPQLPPVDSLEVDPKKIRLTIDMGKQVAQETIGGHYR